MPMPRPDILRFPAAVLLRSAIRNGEQQTVPRTHSSSFTSVTRYCITCEKCNFSATGLRSPESTHPGFNRSVKDDHFDVFVGFERCD